MQQKHNLGLTSVASERNILLLKISSMGWRAQHFDNNGKPTSKLAEGPFLDLDQQGSQRLHTVTKDFIEQLSKDEKSTIERIIVLIEGGSQFAFSDALSEKLAMASKGAIREYGRNLLNQPDVTFGFSDQLRQKSGERAGAIYVFAGIDFLKEFLGTFQTLGLQISHVLPLEYGAMRNYYNMHQGAYATMYVGAFETSIMIMNPALGSQVARSIPVGTLTLAKRLRSWKQLSDEECLTTLQQDGLHALVDGNAQDDSYLHLLQEDLDTFIDELKSSLFFFENQRICGRPDYLEVFGGARRIAGFDRFIQSQIDIEVKLPSQLLIEMFAEFLDDIKLNLLQGIAKKVCLHEVGSTRYTFSNGDFISIKDIESGKLGLSDAEPWSTQDRHSAKRLERKQEEKEKRQYMVRDVKSFALRLVGMDYTAQKKRNQQPEWMQWIVGLYALCALAPVVGYFYYIDLEKSYRIQAQAYLSQKNTIDTMHAEINTLIETANAKATNLHGNTSNIIWGEKLFFLSQLMQSNFALERLSIKDTMTRKNNKSEKTGSIMLAVSMLPEKRNYLDEISNFIGKLKSEDSQFIKGFEKVDLKGVHETKSKTQLIARFSVDIIGSNQSTKRTAQSRHKRK